MGEAGGAGVRAVVCDDDALVRSVVGQLLGEADIAVAGEAETPEYALEVIERTGADVVVLDLALRGGSGEDLLATIRSRWPQVRVIVYSAFASDPTPLIESGAHAVVDKPHFDELSHALGSLGRGAEVDVERRRAAPRQPVDLPPPTAVTPSGFEPWESLLAAAASLCAGDAVLCTDVLPGVVQAQSWDDVFRLDHRVSLGRMVATNRRRTQDRVSLSPRGIPTLLLVGGHDEAATTVYRRLADTWTREIASGTVVGAFALVHADDDPVDRLLAVERAVPVERGERLRMI